MRKKRVICCLVGFASAVLAIVACAAESVSSRSSAPVGKIDFTQDVRPILAKHCFKCHGPDEGARKAKLRLDIRDETLKPAKSDEVPIVPGKPDKSELITRIFTENEDDIMPPGSTKNP